MMLYAMLDGILDNRQQHKRGNRSFPCQRINLFDDFKMIAETKFFNPEIVTHH